MHVYYMLDHVESQKQSRRLCIVVYYIPDGFEPKIKSRGSSKSGKPYYPTLPSTMAAIASETGGPKKFKLYCMCQPQFCQLVILVHYPRVNGVVNNK